MMLCMVTVTFAPALAGVLAVADVELVAAGVEVEELLVELELELEPQPASATTSSGSATADTLFMRWLLFTRFAPAYL
jgi:hypothetical protein